MTTSYSSGSEYATAKPAKLFGRERPIHDVLGGGKGTTYYYLSIYIYIYIFTLDVLRQTPVLAQEPCIVVSKLKKHIAK